MCDFAPTVGTNNPHVVRVMIDGEDVTQEYIVMRSDDLLEMGEVFATLSDQDWWKQYVAMIRVWTKNKPSWTPLMEKYIDEGYGHRDGLRSSSELIRAIEESDCKDVLKLTILAMLEIAPPEDFEVREARLIQWIHEHPDSPSTELLQYTHALVYGERV